MKTSGRGRQFAALTSLAGLVVVGLIATQRLPAMDGDPEWPTPEATTTSVTTSFHLTEGEALDYATSLVASLSPAMTVHEMVARKIKYEDLQSLDKSVGSGSNDSIMTGKYVWIVMFRVNGDLGHSNFMRSPSLAGGATPLPYPTSSIGTPNLSPYAWGNGMSDGYVALFDENGAEFLRSIVGATVQDFTFNTVYALPTSSPMPTAPASVPTFRNEANTPTPEEVVAP